MSQSQQDFFRYLPVSQEDRRWGLFAYGGGHAVHQRIGINARHPAPFQYEPPKGRIFAEEFAALYVTAGRIAFESETTGKLLLSRGDCVILVPGLWHRYDCFDDASATHLWLAFGGQHADHLLRRGVLSRRRVVYRVGLCDRLLQPYRRALGLLQSNPIGMQRALAGSVLEILGAAMAVNDGDAQRDTFERVVHEAVCAMEQRLEGALDMRELAEELSVDYDVFRHAFRRQTGSSPYQYHLALRAQRAQDLLIDPRLSTKEIAARLGFSDQFQFSRAFKKRTGVSPSQWRRNAGV